MNQPDVSKKIHGLINKSHASEKYIPRTTNQTSPKYLSQPTNHMPLKIHTSNNQSDASKNTYL